jgi:hypothetical protein
MARHPSNCSILNDIPELDFFTQYNRLYRDVNLNDDPYANVVLESQYYDFGNIRNNNRVCESSVYLSINIQSLNSKYAELCLLVEDLKKKNVTVDAIAIQETWEIRYADQICLPGFQPILFKNRVGTRGGGVGFYVRNGLIAKVLENLSPFETKIFESLTIQLTYPSKKTVLLTCGYRSNGIIVNVTPAQQIERFMIKFDELLSNLHRKKQDCYIFMDSNIDLLKLNETIPSNLLNTTLAYGFLQCIKKATRIQNESRTLIDHIYTSCAHKTFSSGTIISDVSDHFFTYICTPSKNEKKLETSKTFRSFSQANLNHFKLLLSGAN